MNIESLVSISSQLALYHINDGTFEVALKHCQLSGSTLSNVDMFLVINHQNVRRMISGMKDNSSLDEVTDDTFEQTAISFFQRLAALEQKYVS